MHLKCLVNIFFIIDFVFILSSCGDDINSSYESQGVTKISPQEEINLEIIFQKDISDFDEISNTLVSLRYYEDIAPRDRSILLDAWRQANIEGHKWNVGTLKDEKIRIILSELLFKLDKENSQVYYDLIKSQVKSENYGVRATAALSLGNIGSSSDISVLKEMILHDKILPATQAGFGLISMKNQPAMIALEEALIELNARSDSNSKKIFKILNKHLSIVKNGMVNDN